MKRSMSYNRNRNSGGPNKWQPNNNFGNNLGPVNPWDSGNNLNAQANVLNSLVGNAPDAVQQLLVASKILTNALNPQQGLLQNPQVPSLLGAAAFGNRGNVGNFDRFNNRNSGGRDNWGNQNRRNDSGNYRNNRGIQNNNQRNKYSSNTSLASQKKDNKPKKQEDSVNKEEAASGDKKEEVKPKEENRYADIPKALLYCHVCRKYMWDDVSFDNHVKGRNHKLMLDELDKLYKMQCELMRHDFRMNEQQHGWYFDKAQRMGKKVKKPLEYCTMCDLNYHGTRAFHRKNTKHQELKHFLHPKCNVCNLEFPTRLEWDEHVLLPAHLKKMAARRSELKPELKADDFDFDDFLYVSDLSDYLSSDLKPASSVLTDVTPVVAEKDDEETKNEAEEETEESKEKKEKEKQDKIDESTIVFHPDEEDVIEDFIDNVRNLTEDEYSKKVFVRYNVSTPAGTEFVVQTAGHFCRICSVFVGPREEALKHCKSYSHHISLVNLLAKARKTVRKRPLKDGKEEDDVEMKESVDGGEEGNWKRRKVTKDDGKTMDVDEEDEEDEEAHLNGNADGKEEDSGAAVEEDSTETKTETVEEEKEEEQEEVVKQEPPATPRTAQRARRGRAKKY